MTDRSPGSEDGILPDRESPRDPRILDTLKRHPVHWHTLTASGGFAAVKCFDCGFTAEGGYREVVEKWNAHLP